MAETGADRIYELLHADLMRGRFEPGQHLRSSLLREVYECGISPLREALHRLASEKLVIGHGHRGFRVPPISGEEIRDITSLRQMLDIEALRRSIEYGDDEWEATVVAALHRLNKATISMTGDGGADEWEARHRAFHRALIGACESPWLIHMYDLLYDQTERYRRLRFSGTDRGKLVRDVAREHKKIMDAVLERRADKATSLLSAHLEDTVRYVLANIGNVALVTDAAE
ncbi:MAG: FCD domain-containing protein [Proteobacteria bacterium]|nr:FCD domain-containing protein [Pseudomonadota bacterium]